MRNFIIFAVVLLSLASCECPYKDCRHGPNYPNGGLSFHEEDLIGTWGCTDLVFGVNDVKGFSVSSQRMGEANVILQEYRQTNRFNRTYKYTLYGKTIRFKSKYPDEYGRYDGPYEFKVYDFLAGSLYLQDSRGIHEVRFYSACSGF